MRKTLGREIGKSSTSQCVRAVICLLALFFPAVVQADVNAWVDRSEIADGETVVLTIVASGQRGAEPDTAPLESNFEILGTSTGSQVSIINGRTEARTTWRLTLLPRRTGKLTIPALTIGGERSPPMEIEVGALGSTGHGKTPNVFVETEIDTTTPYVQGQVIYSVRLFHAVELASGSLDVPLPDDVLARQLGEDQRTVEERNGRRYVVIERRFALFPQASGTITLPEPVFDGQVRERPSTRSEPFGRIFGGDPFGDLFSPGPRIRARGESRSMEVRGVPEDARGKGWLPARSLSISGAWTPEDIEVRVGEPLTRTITVEAEGLLGSQLPDVSVEAPDEVKTYPDRAQTENRVSPAGVTGKKVLKIAYVPDRAGSFTLPPVEVWWWDTLGDTQRRVWLPEQTLTVLPGVGDDASRTPGPSAPEPVRLDRPDTGGSMVPVPGTSAGTVPAWWLAIPVLLWLTTLFLWWREHRRIPSVAAESASPGATDSERAARRRFHSACASGNALAARASLLDWAAIHWPDAPPAGLSAVATRIPDPVCRGALVALDRAVYGNGGNAWNGGLLKRCLDRLPPPAPRRKTAGPLPDLYPRGDALPGTST